MTAPAPNLATLNKRAETYSPRKAYALAWLSRVAYAPPEHSRNLCLAAGAVSCTSIIRANVEALVVGVPGALVVAFRGTDATSLRDWIRNLQIGPIAGPFRDRDRLHFGFWLDVENVVEPIVAELLTAGSPRSLGQVPIFVCGHSAGGARAQIFAAHAARAGYYVAGVATYGAPRCGNAAFGRKLAEAIPWLVTHQKRGDAVTRFPHAGIPWRFWRGVWLPIVYRHAGTVRYLAGSGEWLTDPSWLTVARDTWRCRNGGGVVGCLAERISDHGILGYEHALAALVEAG